MRSTSNPRPDPAKNPGQEAPQTDAGRRAEVRRNYENLEQAKRGWRVAVRRFARSAAQADMELDSAERDLAEAWARHEDKQTQALNLHRQLSVTAVAVLEKVAAYHGWNEEPADAAVPNQFSAGPADYAGAASGEGCEAPVTGGYSYRPLGELIDEVLRSQRSPGKI